MCQNQPMISCRNLTARYGDFVAVEGITLDIPTGTICAFLGPNGAGKSTTAKMLTGFLVPTSGEVTVAGIQVTPGSHELKSLIGVLPEGLGLFDDLTVEEHLYLTGRVHGLGREETRSRLDELLHTLDLQHGRHTFASQCSNGMRKKTALAMALLPNPQVLILDEPFEAIDPVASKTIQNLLKVAAERGVTVFLATHVLSAVEHLATQFVMIRGGRIVWASTNEELPQTLEQHYFDLIEAPKTEELAWLGSPPS
jgi:ABC-2 type transport system ATP-binding protein